MNSKRIYTFLIIVGAVIVLTGVIDLLQGDGYKAIPIAGGLIITLAGMSGLRKSNKEHSEK